MLLCTDIPDGNHYMITDRHDEVRYTSLSKIRERGGFSKLQKLYFIKSVDRHKIKQNPSKDFKTLLWARAVPSCSSDIPGAHIEWVGGVVGVAPLSWRHVLPREKLQKVRVTWVAHVPAFCAEISRTLHVTAPASCAGLYVLVLLQAVCGAVAAARRVI